jgi:AI-2 transport protein TqsA
MSSQAPDRTSPESGPGGELRSRLPRSDVVLIAVVGVVAMGFGLRSAAGIVPPTMLALVLTIAVLPVGTFCRRHGWPGWLATLAALASAYLILASLLIGTVICLIKLADVLPQYAGDAEKLTSQVEQWMSSVGLSSDSANKALKQVDPAKVAGALTDVLSSIFGALGGLFLLVTLMFFFVVAVPGFGPRVAALTRSKPDLAGSLATFVTGTQSYLVMTALFGAIVAVLDTGALWLLAVPLPLAWGFFSFITNFIPNIGFIIGVIPPALLALLDSGWQGMVMVIVAYSVLNVTIQTFIQPRFVGSAVGLSAEMTFMSLVVWTFLLGALGALLAVPMTLLMVALFIDPDKRAAWVKPLIATKVEEEQPAVETT